MWWCVRWCVCNVEVLGWGWREGGGWGVFKEFGNDIGWPVPHTTCTTFGLCDLYPFLLPCHPSFNSHLILLVISCYTSYHFLFIPSSNRSISIHLLGMDSTQCIIDRFKPVFHEIEARRDDGHSEEIAEPFTVISYVPLIWIEGWNQYWRVGFLWYGCEWCTPFQFILIYYPNRAHEFDI